MSPRPDQPASGPHARLHALLEELHSEILATGSLDPSDQELARHLAEDMQDLADRAQERGGPERRLGDRLRRSLQALAASRPELSNRVEQLMDQLAAVNL